MKKAITLFLLFIALFSQAQKDTIRIHDTVTVPIYIIDSVATVQVPTLMYEGKGNRVYRCAPGYLVVKRKMATRDGKQWTPVSEPVILGAYDDKKRSVKPVFN